LAALGSVLARSVVVDHQRAAVEAAVRRQRDEGLDPILVMGASATVDRRDVVPSAVVALGGEIVHFGMPVDPGNLLLLARLDETTIVGLPGCARSPKPSAFSCGPRWRTAPSDWLHSRMAR
jgi:molybdenum cofactor cytidylyltransferase